MTAEDDIMLALRLEVGLDEGVLARKWGAGLNTRQTALMNNETR